MGGLFSWTGAFYALCFKPFVINKGRCFIQFNIHSRLRVVHNVIVHFRDGLVHIDRNKAYIRMLPAEHRKHLMGKALPHPLYRIEIQYDLLEFFKPVAYPLCL